MTRTQAHWACSVIQVALTISGGLCTLYLVAIVGYQIAEHVSWARISVTRLGERIWDSPFRFLLKEEGVIAVMAVFGLTVAAYAVYRGYVRPRLKRIESFGRCECGYLVFGVEDRCPECGTALSMAQRTEADQVVQAVQARGEQV